MKISRFASVFALFSLIASAQEYPRQLQFTPQEQQVWQLTMQRPAATVAETQAALQHIHAVTPAAQAWWWAQRCRFALLGADKSTLDQARTALKQLELHSLSSEFAGSAAGYKCQQLSKFSGGVSMDTRQLSFLAYHSLTAKDAPALHAWIGLDYARDAVHGGFYHSAADAIELVLTIARHNQLPQLQADSLQVRADIQIARGQYAEALRSINTALPLLTEQQQIQQLQLTQAGIFQATGQTDQAQALYQSLWQQQSVPAGLALFSLLLQQAHTEQAMALSPLLQQSALQSGDREWIAISRLRHAMLLLKLGQVSTAQQRFDEAGSWLAQHRLALFLPEQLHWAQLLSQQGQHQAAYSALQQSLQLQRQLDAAQHNTQAQLSSTLLIAEQRSRELKLLDVQQQLNSSQAELTARDRQFWQLFFICIILSILLLYKVIFTNRGQKPSPFQD